MSPDACQKGSRRLWPSPRTESRRVPTILQARSLRVAPQSKILLKIRQSGSPASKWAPRTFSRTVSGIFWANEKQPSKSKQNGQDVVEEGWGNQMGRWCKSDRVWMGLEWALSLWDRFVVAVLLLPASSFSEPRLLVRPCVYMCSSLACDALETLCSSLPTTAEW